MPPGYKYLWSWFGFGPADLVLTTWRALSLVGQRALTMQVYLRSSPEVKGLLVEVFKVPVFSLMGNVHRENMQTQKSIIDR